MKNDFLFLSGKIKINQLTWVRQIIQLVKEKIFLRFLMINSFKKIIRGDWPNNLFLKK